MSKEKIAVVASLVVLVAILGTVIAAPFSAKAAGTLQPQAPAVLPEATQTLPDSPQAQPTEDPYVIIRDIVTQVEDQKKIDDMLLAELNSDTYTLTEPFVVVNPYRVAPLSALVLFKTAEPLEISIHVPGKTTLADVDYTIKGYNTVHQIPVYGLYADTANLVKLTAKNKSGKVQDVVLEIQTDKLLDEIKNTSIITFPERAEEYQPGMNFLSLIGWTWYPNAIDINGDFRWYLTLFQGSVYNYNKGKGLYLVRPYRGQYFIQSNPLGKILDVYYMPVTTHHDIVMTDRNTLLVCANSIETMEDKLYEIDRDTGETLRIIDYKDILQRTRNVSELYSNKDWLHLNSVVEYQGDLIISSNFQSTVMRHSWDGTIKWILSDPKGYLERFNKYILRPIGEGFEYPYNQHSAEVLPDYDNNPDTVDIILFDNGTSRNYANAELQRQIRANEVVEPPLYSRIVHYRINEKDMTVEQIWQYGKERPDIYAPSKGGADLLSNGNILGLFNSHTPDNSRASTSLVEVNQVGEVVWEVYMVSHLEANQYNGYRAERLPMFWEAYKDLQIGTPANIFVPKEILDHAQ
jgi:arylsulfate sulfotransferase